MPKVFMLRHQRAGIITSHVFSAPPTEAQQAPLIAECERLHGRDGWVSVHEADLVGDELPEYPKPAPASPAKPFKIEATGTVG